MKVYRNPPKPVTITIEDGKPSTEYDVAVVNNFTTWGDTVTSDAFGNLILNYLNTHLLCLMRHMISPCKR